MELRPQRKYLHKDVIAEFQTLRESDYWPCLAAKTQQDILALLAKFEAEVPG